MLAFDFAGNGGSQDSRGRLAARVVSLSGQSRFQGANAERAAPALAVPVLYAAADGDGNNAAQATSLHDATPATVERKLLLVPGSEHGVDFVNGSSASGQQVRQAVLDFLAAHDRP